MSDESQTVPVELNFNVQYVTHINGRIANWGFASSTVIDRLAQDIPGELIEGVGRPDTHYVANGVIVERPSLPAFDKTAIIADDIDMATLVLPEPMDVTIDGTLYPAVGTLELSAAMPATYVVEIDHFPYQPLRAEIVAT